MGDRTSTQTVNLPKATSEQREAEKLLLEQARKAYGQMGDLSGLASGEFAQISPEILALIEQSLAPSRASTERNYLDALRTSREEASVAGIDRSSSEAIAKALLGQTRNEQLGAIDSQAAQAKLTLPFQVGQQALAANQLLSGIGGGNASSLLQQLVQQRLGGAGSTTTQSGSLFGTAFDFGQAFAGGGAFGKGGVFGKE